jgi:hypothetical protein
MHMRRWRMAKNNSFKNFCYAPLVTLSGPYSETELQNEGRYNVRNFMATVEGASVPYPFRGANGQLHRTQPLDERTKSNGWRWLR